MISMKPLAFALLLLGLSSAFTVNPDYHDIHDTGSESLPTLDVTITIDCDTKDVLVKAESGDTEEPVEGAMAYLFYTDYTYQALPNPGKTDAQGNARIPVPGTLRFLSALFILRVDKQGFQSREIEFAYKKCFEEPPKPPPPPANQSQNASNQTAPPPPQNITNPANASQPANISPPEPPVQDGSTGQQPLEGEEPASAAACPGAFILALLCLIGALTRGRP